MYIGIRLYARSTEIAVRRDPQRVTLQLWSMTLINVHMLCSTFFPSDLTATNELKENIAQQRVHWKGRRKAPGNVTQVRFLLLIFYYYRQIIGSIGMKV